MGTSQVCGVGGHHDQGEEPPHNGHCPGGKCSKMILTCNVVTYFVGSNFRIMNE